MISQKIKREKTSEKHSKVDSTDTHFLNANQSKKELCSEAALKNKEETEQLDSEWKFNESN